MRRPQRRLLTSTISDGAPSPRSVAPPKSGRPSRTASNCFTTISSCPVSSSTTSAARRSPTIDHHDLLECDLVRRDVRRESRPARAVASSGSTSSRGSSTSLPLTVCTISGVSSIVSLTCASGIAYVSSPTRASSARTIASVSGSGASSSCLRPARSECPSRRRARARACARRRRRRRAPTDRSPCRRSRNPGAREADSSSSSVRSCFASSTSPSRLARASTRLRSMPRPSSLTRITTAERSRAALSTRRPISRLPRRDALRRRFDAMVDRVAQQVHDRVADLVEHRAIELDLLALDDELDLLAD